VSAFIALVAFDGTPVDAGIVDRMLDAARVRGGDRRGVWIDGTTALGQCERAVTPGAARLQPCANEEGTVRLVLDGRFDNVADLTGAFTAAGLPLRGCSDVELLLQAYELWGQDCAEHLIGDFAFAIWDSRRRALVCARDVLGTRPLYLHVGDTCIAAASEIAPLLRHPKVSRRPNEGYLAECLNGRARHPSDTVWQDVTRLEPAHALVAERGRVAVRRYWQPDPTRTISYRSDDEYAEHLAELIRVAVASRMRNAPKVGMMLSGGVDSSSIVGAIHELRLAGADQPLATFSLAAAGEPWDETRCRRADCCRLRGHPPTTSRRPPGIWIFRRTRTV
jgi:asparagine synthase (glutamine-hydrolysing)